MARTRLYRNGVLEKENFPVDDISDSVNDAGVVVWLDLCIADGEGLEAVEEEFGLHALAIEDAAHERQRPKLDHYATHLFISAYSVGVDPKTSELTSREIALFVMHNALITVRKDREFDIEQVMSRWDAAPELIKEGAGFLLYGVLDYIVDTHFEAVQDLDEKIDALEDDLFDDTRNLVREVQRNSFELRKNVVLLRRFVLPMREVVNSLMRRGEHDVVSDALMPYYQDVYDHVLRATEWTESLRDLVSTVLETNLTIQGNRMNLIMKQVTSWAAIIAVPTAVTGFYGQNLPYPGFQHTSGFIASSLLIALGSGGLYWIFRRKDWI
ncbi:MAG: magnesium transporter [Actinomycetota bacterium]|nr:magnesium transporter [Actinomycetota bacterium]